MFFVLSIESANRFIQKLIGDASFDFNTPPFSEMGISAMQELGNILSGSYLSALSDFTGLKVYPTVPSLSVDMVGAIVSFGLIEISHTSDEVIVINTEISELGTNGSEKINGHFFLIPDPSSYITIFRSLGVL